jgi:hypothetical protein
VNLKVFECEEDLVVAFGEDDKEVNEVVES